MNSDTASARDAVRRVIQKINECWLTKRYEDIAAYVVDDVVIAPPGSDLRVRGRDAYVESYRDYDQAATTHQFLPGDPLVDVIGDVAVAVCPFFIAYDLEGVTYRETGRETLILSKSADSWRVVWRSVQAEDETSRTGTRA